MADNMINVGPIFRGANGGLSDDLFTGIQNSFYYSENLEIREDMRSIYPCKLTPLNTRVDGTPTAIIEYTDKKWLVFTNSGYVYKFNSNGSTAGSTTVADGVLDATTFAGNVYFTTKTGLYCVEGGDIIATSPTKIATLHSSDNHPLLGTSVQLCIGDKYEMKKIYYSAKNEVLSALTLAEDCDIKLLDYLGGYIRIVIERGHCKNEIGMWDGVNEAINERIPMNGYRFYQSIVYKGYHYLISNKGLGMLNGYQYYIIKRFDKFIDAKNSICIYDDKMYIGCEDGIYIYGAKNKNYPEVLAKWTATDHVGAMNSDGVYLFTSIRGRVGVDAWTSMVGILETMGYYGTSLSEIKQSEYIRLGYTIPTGGYLKVYYKTEAKNEWIEISPAGGLTELSNMKSPFATTIKLNCRFQRIQFKFELKGEGTHLYSADLYYNDMYNG